MANIKNMVRVPARALLDSLLANDSIRHLVLRQAEHLAYTGSMKDGYPKAVKQACFIAKRNLLYAMNKALDKGLIAPNVRKRLLDNLGGRIMLQANSARSKFINENKTYPPGFLTISPTNACNLNCSGCYANSSSNGKTHLPYDVLSRILAEKETLWGNYFTVISGGEPLLWRSEGKTILDIFERFSAQYFLMYTNGTLIDKSMAAKLAHLGNVTPAISIEGDEQITDARRGKGTYKKVLQAFANLREAGVPFGVSFTATRYNADMILDDKFIDFCFEEQGAIYGWCFQYMPIGRAYTLELVITPEQRVKLYRRQQFLLREKKIFLMDFWNGGPMSYGCLAGGRRGGYFYINWNGDISPCVFFPYSTLNIHDVYRNEGTLNTALFSDFFKDIRGWQAGYGYSQNYEASNTEIGNWLHCCPMRDHHRKACDLIARHKAKPIDQPAAEALVDSKYHEMLNAYGDRICELTGDIWRNEYQQNR